MLGTRRKSVERRAPNGDAKTQVANQIFRITAGHPKPLRIDWSRLTEDEQWALIDLVREAWKPEGFSLDRLSRKDLAEFEQLAGKGGGQPSYFADLRALEALSGEIAEFGRDQKKPPRRVELAEPGSITLSKLWAWDFLVSGTLWPAHLAVLVYVMAVFENGGPPLPNPAVSFDGEAIVVERRVGGFLIDPSGNFPDEEDLLGHLAANAFIRFDQNGRTWRIAPGSRLTAIRRAA